MKDAIWEFKPSYEGMDTKSNLEHLSIWTEDKMELTTLEYIQSRREENLINIKAEKPNLSRQEIFELTLVQTLYDTIEYLEELLKDSREYNDYIVGEIE